MHDTPPVLHLEDQHVAVWHGDCLEVLRAMPDQSVHAVVCDPPYGLKEHPLDEVVLALTAWLSGDREHVPDGRGFMGRDWDRFVPPPAVWDEVYRVLKPGGYLLAFAGSRTDDLMGIAIRLAGFEIRDGISWLYAQGFPKGLDIAKALDLAAGVEPRVVGERATAKGNGGTGHDFLTAASRSNVVPITEPVTEAARRWAGWNTGLKPAQEPIVVARRPPDGSTTANILEHGTGGLNVAACRVGTTEGRWPPNALISHPPGCADDVCVPGCPARQLDEESGVRRGPRPQTIRRGAGTGRSIGGSAAYGDAAPHTATIGYDDDGGASRFFPTFHWQAKATTAERPEVDGDEHETVKPVDLIRWLVRLVTPPDGVVLDPFGGSGTTAEACILEGFRAVLVEREAKYLPLIAARVIPYRSAAVLARARGRGVTPARRRARKTTAAPGEALFDLGGS